MTDYIVDTSIFIAAERGHSLSRALEGEGRVSVATLTELSVGVRRAADENVRVLRRTTLAEAQRFIPLAYDEAVAEELADLLAACAARHRRAGAMDAIIAATALVHGLTVLTQDQDFEVFSEIQPRLRVHRG